MTVTIHQPNYLPWLGFFHKMAQADLLVLLDTVPFTKGGYQNRTRIRVQEGATWLTVPVLTKGRLGQPTSAVEIDTRVPWQRKHLTTLEMNYRKAPGFAAHGEGLAGVLNQGWERLAPLNESLIRWLAGLLCLNTTICRASDLDAGGTGSLLLCQLCVAVGATRYLSGPSGREYLDERVFEGAGIEVQYHEFTPVPYRQCYPDFVPGLSAMDFVFNEGAARFHELVVASAAK